MRKTKSKKGKKEELKTSLYSYDCACLRIDTKIITLFMEFLEYVFLGRKAFHRKKMVFGRVIYIFFHEKPSRGLDMKKESSSIKAN